MRRSSSALSAAVLGTALSAATLVAQQPPPVSGPGTSTSPATINRMLATRGARHLVRSGWDYLKYKEYDRALAAFRQAEVKKAELTVAERKSLAQGIDQAKRGLQASRTAVAAVTPKKAAPAAPSVTPKVHRSIRLASATSEEVAAAEPAPLLEPAQASPAAPSDGSLPPINPATLPPAAALSNEQPPAIPEPPAVPPSIEDGAGATPAEAPAPIADPSGALPPAEMPAPAELPAPAPVGAEAPAPEAAPHPGNAPAAPAVETLPPLPEVPEPPHSSPTPTETEVAAAPATESSALVEPAPAPAADEHPTLPTASAEPAAAPAEGMPAEPAANESEPVSVPVLPDSGTVSDLRPAQRRADSLLPSRTGDPFQSSLTPDLQREVEKMARTQDEAQLRDRGATTPEEGAAVGVPGVTSNPATRLEITRAPSPTEARPIRAIPVPDEFTPLPARQWAPNRKYWSAAATCHLPLYFQDASLERYGHSTEQFFGPIGRYLSYPVDDPKKSTQRNQLTQPFFSMGLFAAQVALLPYNLVVDPPWEAEYDLGYYRPGDRVPTDVYYLPLHGVGPPLHGKNY
ncbi:hypothetical protein [Singulisphaera sp. PoT]|uniref:hypothetical protein n=1 Tax=Singulisphaera sp. PoT TaxID=3411797 RepID=UPI003BF5FB87